MNISIYPKEHELREAKQTVEKALEGAKYVLDKEEDLKINLGYASIEEVGEFGVFGSAVSPEELEIFFNSQVDDWKDNLEDLTADLYGRTWFYENSEVNFVWQQILASITGLTVIEKISKERNFEISNFKQEWAEKKTSISKEVSEKEENLSWQLKLGIGHKLLEAHELKHFPHLNRSDVLEAGDALFK